MSRPTVEQWRREVFRARHMPDSTRVLLLLLADHMTTDLKVTVARSRLAAQLGISERRVSERLREAVKEQPDHDADDRQLRLLDRVVRGQKHRQAVYQGLMPNRLSGTPVRPAENRAQGDGFLPPENAENRPAENAYTGSQRDPRGSRLIETNLVVGGTDRDVGSDEERVPRRGPSSANPCESHPWWTCPSDCRNYDVSVASRRRSA